MLADAKALQAQLHSSSKPLLSIDTLLLGCQNPAVTKNGEVRGDIGLGKKAVRFRYSLSSDCAYELEWFFRYKGREHCMMIVKQGRLFLQILLIAGLISGCDSKNGEERETDSSTESDTENDAGVPDGGEDTDEALFNTLLSFMRDELKENGVPGGAIAIVKDGKLKFSAGVGVKREGDSDPVSAETKFLVGSIAKMITAAALMTVVDENQLDIDAPVTNYVPSFKLQVPFDPSTITVRQLLTHTSGLLDCVNCQCDTDSEDLSDWFENYTELPLWSTPGTIWYYSNPGYSLAGLVIEEVAGKPFAQVIQERIFDPLGMSGMTYDAKAAAAEDHAVGHGFDQNQQRLFVEIDTYDCPPGQPSGFLFGDVLGMSRFAEMLLSQGGGVLSAQSVAEMQAPQVDTRQGPNMYYGYGIGTFEYKDLEIKWHNGRINGYTTYWLIVQEKNFGVVVFLNADTYDPGALSLEALNIFLDLPDEEPPDYSTPPETWAKYTGSYYQKLQIDYAGVWIPTYTILVSQDSDLRLWLSVPELGLNSELTQVAGDVFLADLPGLEVPQVPVIFWFNEQGICQYVVARPYGVAERIDDDTP